MSTPLQAIHKREPDEGTNKPTS